MSIADKLTLLADTKEALRVKLDLGVDVPFSEYVDYIKQQNAITKLFLNGEQGVWYDPSDKSTLFQDLAGTIAVTKDGDPVALMRDKSGNGNHAVQTVSASRPVYKTDGVLHWLKFDGVDDWLGSTGLSGLSGSELTNIIAARSLTRDLFNIKGGGVGFEGFAYRMVLSEVLIYNTTPNMVTSGIYRLNDDKAVFGTKVTASNFVCDVNNAQISNMALANPLQWASKNNPVKISLFNTGDVAGVDCGAGDFYGLISVFNSISQAEYTAVNSFLANKVGVTL